MSQNKEALERVIAGINHTMQGYGPASVVLTGSGGPESGCVVFIIPGKIGLIVDEALEKMYAALGWTVAREGRKEAN